MSRCTIASALEPEGGEIQELELLELISRHKPHLLGYYIRQQGSDSALTKRIREPSVGRDDETASKRPRLAFSPSTEQERVHQALTAPIHKGKSSDAFIEFVLGMQQFVWHPGVLARVYDLQFGSRGLSITHFQRRGVMERYRASAQAASLSSDFSVPPPSVPLAKSWGELGAAARSFVAYAQLACDSATVTLAMTLNDFIADLEGREQFEEGDLAILVWWINDGLEKYRHAAAYDAGNGGTSRVKTIDRFSASNPELQGLALAILRERVVRDSEPQTVPVQSRYKSRERTRADRKIPQDVIDCIPVRDNKEVCLHFLSKRGCNSKDPHIQRPHPLLAQADSCQGSRLYRFISRGAADTTAAFSLKMPKPSPPDLARTDSRYLRPWRGCRQDAGKLARKSTPWADCSSLRTARKSTPWTTCSLLEHSVVS
ncbi:hypothetical protein DVH05_014366 [Phytophthora capsici]|nr:hypothetical protein DVH05_014366 [Phytophthora capsici]